MPHCFCICCTCSLITRLWSRAESSVLGVWWCLLSVWSAASKISWKQKHVEFLCFWQSLIVQASTAQHKDAFFWKYSAFELAREWTLNKHSPFKAMLCSTGFAAVAVVKQRVCAHSIPASTVPLAQKPHRDRGQKSCIFCIEWI